MLPLVAIIAEPPTQPAHKQATADLLPLESMALTVALAHVVENRMDADYLNTYATCVLALARVAGLYDWTAEDES